MKKVAGFQVGLVIFAMVWIWLHVTETQNDSGFNWVHIFPMEESGRRCSRAHTAALVLEILQGPGLMLTFCFASPGYGPSLLDPRWLTTTFTMKTTRVRKEREKGHMPPFKDVTQNCSHDFHSRLTGQALLTRSHLPTREVGKYHLYLCDRVPGFCLWERERKWLLKDSQ